MAQLTKAEAAELDAAAAVENTTLRVVAEDALADTGKADSVPAKPLPIAIEGELAAAGVEYDGPDGRGLTILNVFTDKAGTQHVRVEQVGPETFREHDWQEVLIPKG